MCIFAEVYGYFQALNNTIAVKFIVCIEYNCNKALKCVLRNLHKVLPCVKGCLFLFTLSVCIIKLLRVNAES